MKKAAILGLALALGGCANSDATSFAEAYRRGLAAYEQGQPRTARIELLNAIKLNPQDRRARLVQAQVYLALGDGAGAEGEIERLRALGVPRATTAHLMAEALLLEGDAQGALDEAASAAPAFAVDAARMRGRAMAVLGDNDGAAVAFDRALALDGDAAPVWTDLARFRRSNGALGDAIAAADKAVALDPRDVEALTLRGELTRSQYGLRAALPWFDRALQVDKDNVPALLERAATLGELGQAQRMLADTRAVLSLAPDNAMAFFLQAALAARSGNFKLARSLYARTGDRLDALPAAMLLAGAIEYEAGNIDKAIDGLRKLVDLQPDNRKARRLLAAAQWKLGDVPGTMATLRPIVERADADDYSLALAGKAWAKSGDLSAAAAYLARAAQASQSPSLPLAGDLADSGQPDGVEAQVRLIRALLANGSGDEALGRARALLRTNPTAPDAHVLLGDALAIQGDYAAAAEEYREAANSAFTEPVALRLVEALQRSGQSAAAGRVLGLFLDQNPHNVPAQLLAAAGAMQARQWANAIALYEDVRKRLGDRDALMLNNLALAYFQAGDPDRAIPIAKKAWSLDPASPATADTLGWLLFKSGRARIQGLALLAQAARGAPSDAQIRAHLASARRG